MAVQATTMIAQSLLPEFDQEMEASRKLLERVPGDKFDWKPHEKSMPLGRLATHVAELPGWTVQTLTQDELDIAPPGGEGFTPQIAESSTALLELFDKNAREGRKIIESTSDEEFMRAWTLKKGGEELFSAPKAGIMRRFVMNHLIHHRGQLTVFLRLIGVPVPQTLGPTADEPDF